LIPTKEKAAAVSHPRLLEVTHLIQFKNKKKAAPGGTANAFQSVRRY